MATTCISRPSTMIQLRRSKKGTCALRNNHICNYAPANALYSLAQIAVKSNKLCLGNWSSSQSRSRKPMRYKFPVMEWQDCSAEIDVDVPCSVAYQCYSDRETIPQWMPFISSVTVLKDKPDLSRWSLKYTVFERDVEFSWLARNLKPIPNQKIHWRSLEGLPNRGAVRFYPKGASSCRVELTVSYEVPEVLAPVASALKPFLEGLLLNGLKRFAAVAKDYDKEVKH
ncbi:Polyketide cyclase / dehydrase and lipid transport protein [Rhynchospora pubera]|uniref:Polyketide cyclase / dehydrase and lipid transport protein n=1 Tax=Rhynchospora pubera TaxID=906938 RepID=A0AAV8HW64_9POAL|nr:Polyketide cyclase / dehydrase and lipid transport protein [Rhynchospora pubera]